MMLHHKHIYKYIRKVTLSVCLPMLCACDGAGDKDVVDVVEEASRQAITFSSNIAEQEQGLTRAALNSDFKVYGYKYIDGVENDVFPGYSVSYVGNDESGNGLYNYVGEKTGQVEQYWDMAASEYRFWACTGDWTLSPDAVNHTKTLTLSRYPLIIGKDGNATEDLKFNNLYSSLVKRNPSNKSSVPLSFSYPYSQVSVFFYYEEMSPGVSKLQINDVSFKPVSTGASGKVDAVYSTGNFQVTYPTSGDGKESINVTGASKKNEGLTFKDLILLPDGEKQGHGAKNAVQAEIPTNSISEGLDLPGDMPGVSLGTRAGDDTYKYYYPLPMGDQNPDFQLSLTVVELDSEDNVLKTIERTAIVPESFMYWKPNYAYRYFFKITSEASGPLQCDVTIEPWTYGGSQNDTWTNW